MRVNILTQPLFCNYGGILQNYALQTVLRRMGHEPLTVNVPPRPGTPPPLWKDMAHGVINMLKRVRGSYQHPFLRPSVFSRKEHELSVPQRNFVARHINKIDVLAPFSPSLCELHPADAWIIGSDQIWRPWCSPHIANCFFDFIESNDIRRVAYAASFGTDQWEISPEMTEIIKPLAARFDAISVRESSGVALCRDYLDIEAVQVLDPTLLLTDKDYLGLTEGAKVPEGKYIVSYVLDMNSVKHNIIRTVSRQAGMPVVRTGQMHRYGFDSIENWLATIAGAQSVITDSFHGTIFSVIFGRPVKIMTNDTRGNARLDSLVMTLGLTPGPDGFCLITDDVRTRLADMRARSLSFLIKALL